MTAPHWPDRFPRIPDEDWTTLPLGELALKYDTVENHGWYDNLTRTVEQLGEALGPSDRFIDYSGGTGILLDRYYQAVGAEGAGSVLVDSSPKFLRLALEKLRDDPRIAFRLIRYLKPERRLQLLDEVLPVQDLGGPLDALVSTNAVHLYYDLPDTLASWARLVRPGGHVFVQSGNLDNPDAPEGSWIIDETVHAIHAAAVELVREDAAWADWRPVLDDAERMAGHDRLRNKFFLPVRPLSFYVDALGDAGLPVRGVETARIEARVDEWYAFLAAYHEGVLGWVGGSRRVEGTEPTPEAVEQRLALIRAAMDRIFAGSDTFDCCWTYLTATRR